GDALTVGAKAWIIGQARKAKGRAQSLPRRIVVASDHEVAIGRGERLVGYEAGMSRSHTAWDLAGREVAHGVIAHDRNHRFEQRGFDVLTFARPFSLDERGRDRTVRQHAGEEIDD